SCSSNSHKSAPSGTLDYVGDQLITAPAPTGPFEQPQSFPVSNVLPARVLSGANFTVEPRFENDGFLNTYIINSTYGKVKAVSTARLYKRIHEMNVINEIEKISKTKEFAKGVVEKGKDVVHGATSVVLHPIDTVTGAVTGVGKLFKRVGENVGGQARSDQESRFQDVIGYSKTKRDYANQLKVDVYSRNPLLQADLNSLAESGYAGNMLTALAISSFTGPVITATGTSNLLNKVVKDMAPADLRRMNREKLEKMGVLSTTADAFVKNGSYTPREQTVLVNALFEMKNTQGRDQFVKFATDADHYDVTYFRQLQAEMYADHNRNDTPIKQFINLEHFAAGVTRSNGIVVCFPLDYLMWTVDMAKVATTLTYKINALSWVTNKHMYLTGTLSPLARKNLTELGWKITDNTSALR
ncbi:MAG: hypothetical protein KAI17_15295, partial [Thiotrichaceae bacterium]|nr:hypothetical protein [Thiotrichaceae bacterium]